jgi:cell division protein FtsI (penicillin-binding protein 3)
MNTYRMNRRRIALALVAVFAVVALFAIRLVDIQVVRADELNEDSRGQRTVATTTYAARGDIVDRDGVVLAGSIMRYDLVVSPRTVITAFTKDSVLDVAALQRSAGDIAAITGQTPAEVLSVFQTDPESVFAYVTKGVTVEQMRAVRELDIPGMDKLQHPARIYPDGAVAGNLVGFVGTDGPQEGLEVTENACLASTDGQATYQQGADGIRLPGSTVTSQDVVPGGTVTTTVDRDLSWSAGQALAEQAIAIGAESAHVSIVKVKTGEILSMVDWPAVDPNDVDATAVVDPGGLASKAFTTPYEPGSTFKPMTAAILLDQGAATAATQVVVPYSWTSPEGSYVSDAAFHDEQHLTLAGVIQQSSNVGISKLAVKVPNEVRYDYMKAFGVGERTSVGFLNESTGGAFTDGNDWDDQTKYNVAFGQGVSSTAAQIAQIYQILGNGGVKVPLSLVSGCTTPDGTVVDVPSKETTRVVSEGAADTVVEMMEGVVNGGGLAKQLQIPGYRVAAKSGTAEVAENGVYTGARVVSIAGLAPADDPEYSVIVTFVKPSTIKTSAAAAPTFKKIMTQVLKSYQVTPSTTPPANLRTTW